MRSIPELLAPAGNIEVFEAAVAAGADAVYIGAPSLNARALARNFSWPEVAAMIDHGHRHGVKVYTAMNSLMKEAEIPLAVETLASFEALKIDGLIIQDLGIYHLARTHFPNLRLHASTLMGAHNSLAVRQFERMGFSRVVLARELTLEEIAAIRKQSGVELEVFVHGALCFSYSGLCLFSSFLGGKSGLRGRCVQPCRRRYNWQGQGKGPQSGYFFSMNDLEGIDSLARLREIGVSSFKIEGRMRSAHYVANVVRAYRIAIDGSGPEAMAEARSLLGQSMGRKTTAGYFPVSQPADALSPQHSGNIGTFLGKAERVDRAGVHLTLKASLGAGDRLRVHHEKTGERTPFTLKNIWIGSQQVTSAGSDDHVRLEVPFLLESGDSLYKVDVLESRKFQIDKGKIQLARFTKARNPVNRLRIDQILKRIAPVNESVGREKKIFSPEGRAIGKKGGKAAHLQKAVSGQGRGLPYWVRIDDLRDLAKLQGARYELVLINLDPSTYQQFQQGRKKYRHYARQMAWALPPIIHEERLDFYRQAIDDLVRSGFTAWQVGHIGQLLLFEQCRNINLLGDYTLNLLNSLSCQVLQNLGIRKGQLSVETDRDNARAVLAGSSKLSLGLMLFGRPPLFIARLAPDYFRFGKIFISPKGERFILKKKWGLSLALPLKIYSLLSNVAELAGAGIRYGVIDLSNAELRKGGLDGLINFAGKPGRRADSTFNYLARLE